MSDTSTTPDVPTTTDENSEESTTITLTARTKRWIKVGAATLGGAGLVALGYVLGSSEDEDSDEISDFEVDVEVETED